jgi:glycosyltransferase involved in cell wall biosynthesis
MPNKNIPKVAYIMRSYPVLYQATVFNEIRFLSRDEYDITVFSLLPVDPAELRRDGISDLPKAIYCWQDRLPAAGVVQANLALLAAIGPKRYWAAYQFAIEARILTNLRSFMRFAAWAYELKRRGITHLHAHWATEATTVAMIFSWLTDLPFSFTAHAYDIFYQPQFLARKLSEVSFAVTVSAYNKQYMVDTYGPALERKIHVIYPLIDLSQFEPRAAAPGNGLLSIVSIGRLTEYKGFINLVETCRVLRERRIDFLCQIVGEGEDRPMLEEAIACHGLQDSVKLLGSLPYQAVPQLLEQATVFALPCVIARNQDRDGMPIVLIEAMARCVPIVSSDVIGLPELVRPQVGILVPPCEPVEMAEAFLRIKQEGSAGQETMGQAGRQIVENELDAAIGAARLDALFRGVGQAQTGSQPMASARRTALT